MRVLITGASGFAAQQLIPRLGDKSLFLTDIRPPVGLGDNFVACDLGQASEVNALIQKVHPQQVFHLAGTFTNNFETDFAVNCLSTRNILEATLKLPHKVRVLLVGSAAEYGAAGSVSAGLREDTPLAPVSVYGLSKSMQSQIMGFYTRAKGADIVMARIFNLLGKGLSPNLFVGRVYEQIEGYKQGNNEKISLGNLQASRDYIDSKAATDALLKIMNFGKTGEVYNVGSGAPIKIKDLLKTILEQEGLGWELIEEDSSRSAGVAVSYADISKLTKLASQ